MGKKGKKGPRLALKQASTKDEKPNLFERMFNRKKFDVLGKKAKGQQRKLGQSRSEAVEKRKKTLLVEYRQLKKSNVFVDRRFGENDENMTEEDRAIARFQKERMRELAGSAFTLAEEEGGEEPLTHMGRSLADMDYRVPGLGARSDDEDEDLPPEVVREHHFGGFVRKEGGEGSEAAPQAAPKSKKQVMEEIIAKSKAGKVEKRMQREEDEEEVRALDERLKGFLAEGAFRSLMRAPGRPQQLPSLDEGDAQFDLLQAQLRNDRRGGVGDRLKTVEELEAERERRENAEKALQRKRAAADGDEAEAGLPDQDTAAVPTGGFAARRRRAQLELQREQKRPRVHGPSGDALEDDFEGAEEEGSGDRSGGESGSDGSENGASDGEQGGRIRTRARPNLQERQAQRAAGNHPLQVSFRAAAAKLAAKYGVEVPRVEEPATSADDEDGSLGTGEEGEDASGSDEDEESGSSEADEDVEAASDSDGEDEDGEGGSGAESDDDGDTRGYRGRQGEAGEARGTAGARNADTPVSSRGVGSGNDGPGQGRGKSAPAQDRGETSSEAEAVARSGEAMRLAAGAVKGLPDEDREVSGRKAAGAPREEQDVPRRGAVGEAARSAGSDRLGRGEQARPVPLPGVETYPEFLRLVDGKSAEELGSVVGQLRGDILKGNAEDKRRRLQVLYSIVVQHFALRADAVPFPGAEIDALTPHLCLMTGEVPYFAAQVARTRLLKMQHRLGTCLGDPSGVPGTEWPAARHLMLLRLWALLFPVSDRRHPVLTPAALLLGEYLTMCRVTQPRHAAIGLFLAALALHMAAPEQRFTPEPLCFAVGLLRTALLADHPCARDPDVLSTVSSGPSHRGPTWLRPEGGWPSTLPSMTPLCLRDAWGRPDNDAYYRSPEFCGSVMLAALGTLGTALNVFKGAASLPEIMAPARAVLDALGESAGLPKELEEQRGAVAEQLRVACEACVASRKKLRRKPGLDAPEIKQYNPRFEEDFTAGKDYDPDRSRAEERRLRRQVKKETRSAMRELRKDADFLGAQKSAERAAADAKRRAERRRGLSLLEQQEADFKSGGQKGMWKKGKKLR